MNLEVALLKKIESQPNSPGITRAISDQAEVWEIRHPGAITLKPSDGNRVSWPTVDFDTRSHLAIFPAIADKAPIELFLSSDLVKGETATLVQDYVTWGNGDTWILRFPGA